LEDVAVSDLPNNENDAAAEFPIVGAGASAGGLEALQHLFRGLEAPTGMAFVVVQHLSPDFETMVDELLARETRLPIRLAENNLAVEPETIYVMPPKVEMIIASGRLLLSEREPERGLWLPIDAFFRSLAEDAGARAVGVVLSGTGSDGSRGLHAIHDAGGLTVAQDPRTARFDGMPRSAIDTGVVDLILRPEQIRHALTRYASRLADGTSLVESPAEVASGATAIFDLLHKDSGIDFSHYKTTTIGRRLDRRLLLTHSADINEYAAKVRAESEERDALYQDLLIGVTSFFREPPAFEVLAKNVIPDLIRKLPDDEELRVWSAGCATGEEAYSLAILILERFRELDVLPRLRLFATDVYPKSLEVASTGIYDAEHVAAGFSEELLDRYFMVQDQKLQVRPEVRNRVVFARHNLLRDAPFTRLDLITCRNVLIYFKPSAQKKLIALFHFALRTGGTLFLGPSETPSVLADEFAPVDHRWKIYRKRREVRIPPELQLLGAHRRLPGSRRRQPNQDPQDEVIDWARDSLLAQYAPPSLLVSSAHSLIHSFQGGNQFLHTPEGSPSLQILDMVDGELKYALAGALKRAADEGRVVRYEQVPATTTDGAIKLRLSITPRSADGENYFLVTLESQERPAILVDTTDLGQLAHERIDSLELELRYAKENLQATIEEMETSNEELQATNEELIASNEELHSANEELQSVNEELHSVNAEHQLKIQELRELTSDMEHLLAATEIHTLFLDDRLCLRKFTPKMGETFRIREADIGRRIDDFAHRLVHGGLTADLEYVLSTGERIQREVSDRDGVWYLLRILPYQPRAATEGVVLTLIDITNVKTVQRELSERKTILHELLKYSPAPLWVADRSGHYLLVGRAAANMYGFEPREMVGKTLLDLIPRPRALDAQILDQRVLVSGDPEWTEDETQVGGEARTFQVTRFPLRDADGAVYAVGGVASDITDRKRAEQQAHLALDRRDRFLAMLSHELRNPLAAIANGLHLLEEESDPGRRKRAQAVARHQVEHMSKLLDDLLDVTRIAQGRMRVRKEHFTLNQVVRAAIDACRQQLADRDITLVTELCDQPLALRGDATRIEQVIAELLENASRFTPRGGTVILRLEQDEGIASVRIRDTGEGLTLEEQSQIFDLFYQRDDTIDRGRGGLGIGLALARDLIDSHGGTIEASSAGRDKGSEITVRLPLVQARASDGESPPSDGAAGASLRVVIVEDSEDSLELLKLFLEHLGHEAHAAATGPAGLEAIIEHKPDLALVDIGLPGMSGLEVARAVREHPGISEVYLVALTGYGRDDDRRATAEAGFDEHLTKPVSRETLERVLGLAAKHRVRR
jgi:two-component system, chemotaxis family, CheB/CheR fusion protein